MKIDRIQTDLFYVPLPQPMMDSTHGRMEDFSLVTVRVISDEGEEGLGYTYGVGRTGGPAIHSLIEHDLIPLLNNKDPRRIEQIWEEMWWHLHYVGRGGIASFAISAVDTALWDLQGRIQTEPLWKLLGGHSNRAHAYVGGIDLNQSLDGLLEQTGKHIDRGFRAIKMKVGKDRLTEDVERVKAMRELVGSDVTLMVDANMLWPVEHAIQAAKAFAPFDIYWLEEPTIPDDVEGHAKIAREGGVPIATGENLHTIYEFQKMIQHGGISFPEPDVSNIGGITAWMKVAHLAECFNLPVTTHGVHDLHVHLLGAIPNASYLEVHGFGLEEYIRNPLEIRDGVAVAPDRLGHGVEFDWDSLEMHRAHRK